MFKVVGVGVCAVAADLPPTSHNLPKVGGWEDFVEEAWGPWFKARVTLMPKGIAPGVLTPTNPKPACHLVEPPRTLGHMVMAGRWSDGLDGLGVLHITTLISVRTIMMTAMTPPVRNPYICGFILFCLIS